MHVGQAAGECFSEPQSSAKSIVSQLELERSSQRLNHQQLNRIEWYPVVGQKLSASQVLYDTAHDNKLTPAGWSIGGGHGPHAPSRGLGVDNILEAQIVTATGRGGSNIALT